MVGTGECGCHPFHQPRGGLADGGLPDTSRRPLLEWNVSACWAHHVRAAHFPSRLLQEERKVRLAAGSVPNLFQSHSINSGPQERFVLGSAGSGWARNSPCSLSNLSCHQWNKHIHKDDPQGLYEEERVCCGIQLPRSQFPFYHWLNTLLWVWGKTIALRAQLAHLWNGDANHPCCKVDTSRFLSKMSHTQQALHIFVIDHNCIGYVFILGKLRASWESRRGSSSGWRLRVDMAESGDSYGRLPECWMAALHPEVSYYDQKRVDGMTIQREQRAPKPRAPHKHSVSQHWSAWLDGARRRTAAMDPARERRLRKIPRNHSWPLKHLWVR